MEKILVGIDGSEGSEQALNRAIKLIDEYGEIILIAVIPTPQDNALLDNEMYGKIKKKAEVMINDVISDLGVHDFKITGLIDEGDPAGKIIDVASKLNVDLIVLGSRGTSELATYTIGSIANKVVQYAHKPVMVVR